MKNERHWDGRTVHLAVTNPEHDHRYIELAMNREAAESLRATLRLASQAFPQPLEVGEILEALSYVLGLGDIKENLNAYERMQRGKGMTPDGGYKAPRRTDWRNDEEIGPRYT